MCVDVVTKGTVEGETRESTFAQGRSELAVGSPCEVSIRGWMGWDGSTHTLSYRTLAVGSAGRKLGIDHNQLFAQSVRRCSAVLIGHEAPRSLVRTRRLGQARHT